MADETYDPRLDSLLRGVLAAEAARLPLTVRPDQILERADRLGRSGGSRRRGSIFGWPTIGLRQPSFALGGVAVLVVAGVLAFATLRSDLTAPAGRLPTTPDAWTRVVIPAPAGSRLHAIAAGPRGLLAVVFEQDGDGPTRLMVSTDGRDWVTVPDGRNPFPWKASLLGGPSVVATDHGFLMMFGNTVWTSGTGADWRKLGSEEDPDLSQRWMRAAVQGGPGLVAVGSDPTAWYSVDASDWTRGQVPPLPAAIQARRDAQWFAEMTGLAAAGDRLVAWGEASAEKNGDQLIDVPLLWASDDGQVWSDVVDPRMGKLVGVAAGPGGFVAADHGPTGDVLWSSTDGRAWTPVEGFDAGKLTLSSVAAGSFGYVVAAADATSGEVTIWASADGRSWSRVDRDDRLVGGSPSTAVAWGSRFVVGGLADNQPTIWISDIVGPAASPAP